AQAKDTIILKLREKLHSLSGDVNERKVKREVEEMKTLNIELDHKSSGKSIGDNSSQRNYKQSQSKKVVTKPVSLNPIDPELLKIDVVPLALKLRKNRIAHTDYIRHTQEEEATLREIVENERLLNPLNTSLDYALKRKIWQPTEKVFKTVGHKLKPTGRIFTLVENVCPLTRIATTTTVPPREPIPIVNNIDKSVVTLVYSRKIKAANKKVPVCNSMIFKSFVANKLEPNNSWGSSSSNVPSPLIDCRLSKLSSDGVDLLTGSRGNNLYTLSLQDMMVSSPIYLLSKASKTKSNFGAINHLARQGLVRGLPKLKFKKDHLYSACEMGKSTKKTHKPKSEDTNQEKLYLLHMDLCRPMRVESVNEKKYILVIVDDYSRFPWVKLLRSKDETPDFIIKFLKMIQNGVVERRNRTLIEAARTMLIYAQALLFLWAEDVATACFTQNRSIIRLRHEKTPYELLHSKLPDLSFFHVFGALCYPTNNSKNVGKLQPKVDIEIFIGYAPTKKAFRIYNRRTRRIVETIHVDFDELTAMASKQISLGSALNEMTPGTISSGLVQNSSPSTSYVPPSRNDWDLLFQPMFDELLNPPPSVDHQATKVTALIADFKLIQSVRLLQQRLIKMHPPQMYKEALTQSCWIEAMQEELNEFERLEVWELVPRPDKVMDNPNHVYKLKKALYGLKQAPRAWFDMLSLFLLSQDFSKGLVDPTLFIRRNGNDLLL
nr:hypothetical protein [Tanacetum cinerariifolium]